MSGWDVAAMVVMGTVFLLFVYGDDILELLTKVLERWNMEEEE